MKTIPGALYPDVTIAIENAAPHLRLTVDIPESRESADIELNAAGVRTLVAACVMWLVRQREQL